MGKKIIMFGAVALSLVLAFSTLVCAETDVTDKIRLEKSRLRYDRRAKTNYSDVAVRNISDQMLIGPIKVIIDSISSADVTVANADGTNELGKPYFEYNLAGESLGPNETIAARKWIFSNPFRRRFYYQATVKAGDNLLPIRGYIDLPETVLAAGLQVQTPAGQLAVHQDRFSANEYLKTTYMVTGTVNGNVTALSFFNPKTVENKLSCMETATSLVVLKSFLIAVPPHLLPEMLNMIRQVPEVSVLAGVICNELSADPAAALVKPYSGDLLTALEDATVAAQMFVKSSLEQQIQ